MRIGRRTVLLAPSLLLARCAAPPPPPATLDLTISGSANQNPDPSGQATPVMIRLYELTATGRFNAADVFALSDNDKAALGSDEVASDQIALPPGAQRSVTRQLQHGAQFLGIAVLFRDIDHAHWRAVAPVAASGPTKLTLKVSGLDATLAPG